jgi:hypothetical protein
MPNNRLKESQALEVYRRFKELRARLKMPLRPFMDTVGDKTATIKKDLQGKDWYSCRPQEVD